jgi:hypothetical protein
MPCHGRGQKSPKHLLLQTVAAMSKEKHLVGCVVPRRLLLARRRQVRRPALRT